MLFHFHRLYEYLQRKYYRLTTDEPSRYLMLTLGASLQEYSYNQSKENKISLRSNETNLQM